MLRYLVGNKLRGVKRFPFVLMLEPLFQCNLRCKGCGKVRQPDDVLQQRLSADECVQAVDECGAPAVSIAGGEPLILPDIESITARILAKGKLVLLCTNGLLIDRKLAGFAPHPDLVFVFHVDGLGDHHDRITGRKGVFSAVLSGIERCKSAGFRVATNTTLYRSSQPSRIAELLRLLMGLGVDDCIISPAFAFEELDGEQEDFLSRVEAQRLFRQIEAEAGRHVRYYNTPMYRDFLRGGRSLRCTPWGNPTRDPQGWKSPCYLLTDRHYATFTELMEQTPWEDYGYGNNPRCAGCVMHSGYEATALAELGLRDILPLLRWMLT